MAKSNTAGCQSSSAVIQDIEITPDTLTGRAGLALFSRYLRNIGILPHLERLFGGLRKSKKGQAVGEIFKQIFCFFVDGTSPHLSYYDDLKKDSGYGGAIESDPDSLVSSHAVKRFFGAFHIGYSRLFQRLLEQLFLWRLAIAKPPVIWLGLDTMVMDNDDAECRQGVAATYKNVKGFQPLQLTWERFIVAALFRRGDKHSNHKDEVAKMITRLVKKIRKNYCQSVPILIRADSGFFDQKLMRKLESLNVGFVIAGKLYPDTQEIISSLEWKSYKNGDQEWVFVEFGDRRGSWKKFRRAIFSRPFYDDLQRWLEFARPDSILYTNLGCGQPIDEQLRAAGLENYFEAEQILEGYHQRGKDELVHRAVKDFASQSLPFKNFHANRAYYYCLVVSFFLYEAFKEDVCHPVIPLTSYATTFRRRLLDIAGKIVSHSHQVVLKVTQAAWDRLQLEELWKKSSQPPEFVWLC